MGFDLTTAHQLAPVIVPWMFLILATLVVALRFQSRSMQKAKYGIDDWLVLAALIITYAYQACNTYAMTRGVGLPMMYILTTNPTYFVQLVKSVFVSNILWSIPVTVLQLAVLTLYLRLFGVKRWVRFTSWFLMGISILYALTFFITQFTSCVPLKKFWEPTTPGKCFNQYAFCASMGLIHVVIDFAIVLLPMPLIWNLHTTKSNKCVLTLVLGVGLFTSVASLLKLTCLIDFSFISKTDVTLGMWYSILMQAIEIPLGIICTCIPTLSPVVTAAKQSAFGSSIRQMVSSLNSRSRRSRSATPIHSDSSREEKINSTSITTQKGSFGSHSRAEIMYSSDSPGVEEQSMVDLTQPGSIRVDRTWDVHR